jgi:hypothetical protein
VNSTASPPADEEGGSFGSRVVVLLASSSAWALKTDSDTATSPGSACAHGVDDFDADIAERYGWVNRTLDDDDLDSFVDTLVRRLASFDREALAAVSAALTSGNGNMCPPGVTRLPDLVHMPSSGG